MDIKEAFVVLGVEQTKEENRMKEAYRKKLRLVNPEDDPEGFKQLRLAYETALAFAAQKEEAPAAADDTPSGQFLQKAAALYESIDGRQDEKAWKALFWEPVFLDLDEEENCREKLLTYLMTHCYLPTPIWKILDQNLDITEGKERLYEKFPRDFIDYAGRKIKQGEDFEFEQLEGPKNADLDGWILLFVKAGREENEENYEAMEETVREAEEKGISHPGLSMMKARLLQATDRSQEGDAIVNELLEGPFAHSLNVRYQSAEYYWQEGQTEKAAAIYQDIRTENRKHYMANRRLAKWYLDRGDYAAAKECVNVILSYPLNDEGRKLVDQVNSGLERELERKLEEHPEDLKVRLDLGWCLLQDEKPQEAMELMAGIRPDAKQEKDYVNLMGKVLYYANQYEQARPVIERWARLLREEMPDGGQEEEDDRERLATACTMLSKIDEEKAKTETGAARENAFGSAIRLLEEAKAAHDSAGQDYAKASIFQEWGKYEECERICARLARQYPDFSAAVVLHQEACAKLFDASGVIGDYYTLRRILPDYSHSWELAAEVFYQLKNTEELDRLLAEAKENHTLTLRLKKYRFLRMAEDAEKKSELLDALEYAKEIRDAWEQEDWDDKEKADLYAECARNYWRLENSEAALGQIDLAIELSAANLTYVYIRAGIKKDQGEYEEALQLYLRCTKDYDETAHYYSNVGECYYKLGDYGQALPNLKKAVEIREDNPVCCAWIIRILKAEMEKTDSTDKMEEAFAYANLMIEHRPQSFFFIERGLLSVMKQEYEKAAQDFECAVAADGEDPFAHSNLARMYRLLNRMTEAEEQGKLAVKYMEHDPAPYHHEVLGNIYLQMHRYEEAQAAFLTNWERYPGRRVNLIGDMVSLYLDMGKWEEAQKLLQDVYRETDPEYATKTVEIYCSAGFFDQAVRFVKNHGRSAGLEDVKKWEALADIYWYQGKLRMAAHYIKRALRHDPEDSGHDPALCKKAAGIYFFLGKKRAAAGWADRALQYYKNHGGYEKWLNPLDGRLNNLSLYGMLQLYAGNVKAAEDTVAEMKQSPRCTWCNHCCCTDALELEADILADRGEDAQAISVYEEILKENGRDEDVRMKLALIKRKRKR